MPNSVQLEIPYIPLIQKPMCSAVACLQMILYRNGYGLQDQEALAVKFGVKIDAEFAKAFETNMPLLSQLRVDEGVQTIQSVEMINALFQKTAPALKAVAYKASEIPELKEFLIEHLKCQHDIWVEYHAQDIHADDVYNGQYIHYGLIEKFNATLNSVVVIDPVPEHKQRLEVPLTVLKDSISTSMAERQVLLSFQKISHCLV